ncbi:MAG TPA: electron transport complex subunit RsxC [Spongiibacteraceae bacterium]|jgi:electron transport complex protein RnfC|nr:electron transport complex subunit RsxC [Spongiibacteraceae bacterium]HUH36830.1 electron transport complex subunit RsxC [Spongiibacteraceae bacterium]
MRQVWDFHGGIHPPENKHQSTGQPIRFAGIPTELVLPLAQHIGAPAEPVVAVGDAVLKGQVIASAKGLVSVPVHAPTSGTVVAIEDRPVPQPSGLPGRCIVIHPDGQERWIERKPVADYTALEPAALIALIRDAGIAGMGGAGFPAAVKLHGRPDKVIDTLLINGTECEPYITADDLLMRERASDIVAGIRILQHLVRPTEATLIGIEDNKPEAIEALRNAARGSGIEVVVFPTKYPSGGEKQLIQIVTGREVPSGGLPADIGIVCQNVGTAAAIARAVLHGEPLISRITTVTGEACREQRNYEVLLGTSVQFLLDMSGFEPERLSRLIIGGPMMGYAITDLSVPVVKTTNCILAPTRAELPPPPPAQACIRCGLCSEACPVSLLPQQMYWFARGKEWDKLEAQDLFDCIECGACSYVCPSTIPLVQYYRAGKAEIRKQREEKAKAEHAKQRFEARQARIAQLEAEKEAKRQARLQAAKAPKADRGDTGAEASTDVVAAALARVQAKKASDPAADVIARAQARRAGTDTPESPAAARERLQQNVASAEKRLDAARRKLAEARAENSDKLAAFETAVTNTEARLRQAQEALAALPAPADDAAGSGDAPADIIARAQAKRAAGADAPDAATQRANLEKRLAAAEAKLAAAREQKSDKIDAFETSVTSLREKLASLAPDAENTSVPAPAADPAQDAIARAMAARASRDTLSPGDKAEQAARGLEERLAKARTELDAARADGSDNIAALEDAVAKLADKLERAQRELAERREGAN